jgi:hypothetical protein
VDLIAEEIPLIPPFPKGEVRMSTIKHPLTLFKIAEAPIALLLRFSIKEGAVWKMKRRKAMIPKRFNFPQ